MALKFWLGDGRSDKSDRMLEYIVKEAEANPQREYLVIVPEQFNFAAQKKLVMLSKRKGVLNVDVLSFMRLAHRITDEVGYSKVNSLTLDDMGKNLIIQLIAERVKGELTVFDDNVGKLGFVTKIKSMISEFMQYGIKPDRIEEMIKKAQDESKGVLAGKLSDTALIYKNFLKYIEEQYTTTEEILDVVSSLVHNSETIKDSIIIFDGFTGFTPVQLKLIGTLMDYAAAVHVALMNDDNKPELFGMSRKTINTLEKMAVDRRMHIDKPYEAKNDRNEIPVCIFDGQNPEAEVEKTACIINDLIRNKGYRYRDIAIVSGDVEIYRHAISRIFDRMNIPYFVDKTQPILLNPFVEYLRSLIAVFTDNYSYDSVFGFLKAGIIDIDKDDIDRLDNYCLATGVKGKKQWHTAFYKPTNSVEGEDILLMEELRKKVICEIDGFASEISPAYKDVQASRFKGTVRHFAVALYHVIEKNQIEKKLSDMSEIFADRNEMERAEEYRQIYVRVMNILDELVLLIPDEIVDVKEFGELLSAGFDEIRIGVMPQNMDYVQIGDLTRSRIDEVKTLFIVGANDGIIPQMSGGIGIINDSEREFLIENIEELQLAPTAKEDIFNQELYIYMALTKPDNELFISYSRVGMDGKSLVPSYIIRQIKKENSKIISFKDYEGVFDGIYNKKSGFIKLISLIRDVVENKADDKAIRELKKLIMYYSHESGYRELVKKILEFVERERVNGADDNIGRAIAKALYGKELVGSVTRLEVYANCAYRYFLQYGLGLKERESFSFDAKDMGVIFHDSLSEYSKIMNEHNLNWFNVEAEVSENFMNQAVEKVLASNDSGIHSNARTEYAKRRIERIMNRTARVITEQVKQGEFVPKYFEIGFDELNSKKSVNIRLSDESLMKLLGRVDRIDTCEKEDGVYVRIVDYKSSHKSMDLTSVYEGRQLQLLVYLNAAMENEEKSGKQVIPAGVFYYQIDDPVIDTTSSMSDEEIEYAITKELKLTGLVNSDNDGQIIEMMDSGIDNESRVLNVSKTKSGLRASKQIISGDDFTVLTEYVKHKISDIGQSILDGNIGIPIADGVNRVSEPDCTYCKYRAVCCNGAGYTENTGVDAELLEDDVIYTNSNEEMLQLMRRKLS